MEKHTMMDNCSESSTANELQDYDSQPPARAISGPMDRRDFFRKLCAISATAIFPVACSSGGGDSSPAVQVDSTDNTVTDTVSFSKLAFVNNIDTVFSVTHDTYGVIDLQLTNVEDATIIEQAEQFIIALNGPESPVLTDSTHQIYNQNLGNFELYLQTGSSEQGRQNYIAVFSLLHA